MQRISPHVNTRVNVHTIVFKPLFLSITTGEKEKKEREKRCYDNLTYSSVLFIGELKVYTIKLIYCSKCYYECKFIHVHKGISAITSSENVSSPLPQEPLPFSEKTALIVLLFSNCISTSINGIVSSR